MKKLSIIKKFAMLLSGLALIIMFELSLVVLGVDEIEKLGLKLNEREIPVLTKAYQVQRSVIEVQQWLTDISATRGLDGLNDGFQLAQEHADQFYRLIDELIQIDPSNAKKYRDMIPAFDSYYQTGKEMARAYVELGPEGGNKLMDGFDQNAAEILAMVEDFVDESLIHSQLLGQTQKQYLNWGMELLIVGFCVLLVILSVVFGMMKKTLRPLPIVVSEFDLIAQGDLTSTRKIAQTNDEIGQLAEGFEHMRQRLRDVIKNVDGISDTVNTAAHDVSNYTDEAQVAMNHQSNDIETIASSITQLSAAAHDIARSADGAALASNEANRETINSQEVVKSTMDAIAQLASQVTQASDVLVELENDSNKIGKVLEVIGDIAEQTNLLALNAAIEAARAGDQGRGFAVVADEVRALASRTQESTIEIQQIIGKLQIGSKNAVRVMEESQLLADDSINQTTNAVESLVSITESVNKISEMTAQIAATSEQQSVVSVEIAESINKISNVSDKIARDAEKAANAGKNMANQVIHLRGEVANFKL